MKTFPKHTNTENDNLLMQELNKMVNERIQQLPKSRLTVLKIKTFVYPIIYLGFYFLAINQVERVWLFFVSYAIMGLCAVIMFVELIHELCHGNIFKKAKHNNLAYNIFDLLGANSYIWKQRHLKLHHRYPNVNGWDADFEQKGLIILYPEEQSNKYKKYQHIYIFLLYPFYMFNWLVLRDFRDYFANDRIANKALEIPKIEYFKIILFKGLYIFIMVFIPWLFFGFSLIQSMVALLLLTVSGSILAMIVLLPSHANIGNDFIAPDSDLKIKTSWMLHQLLSCSDISNSNWFTRHVMGNFNYHVAHHLLPRISNVYAPEVTEVIKTFVAKHNLPYKSYPLFVALKKHYQLIRNNALRIKMAYQ